MCQQTGNLMRFTVEVAGHVAFLLSLGQSVSCPRQLLDDIGAFRSESGRLPIGFGPRAFKPDRAIARSVSAAAAHQLRERGSHGPVKIPSDLTHHTHQ